MGLVLLYLGWSTTRTGVITYWHTAKVYPWVGYLELVCGTAALLHGFFGKPDRSNDQAALCPDCGAAHKHKFVGKPCSKCGATLEPIEGFYERHPELDNDTIPTREEVFKDK